MALNMILSIFFAMFLFSVTHIPRFLYLSVWHQQHPGHVQLSPGHLYDLLLISHPVVDVVDRGVPAKEVDQGRPVLAAGAVAVYLRHECVCGSILPDSHGDYHFPEGRYPQAVNGRHAGRHPCHCLLLSGHAPLHQRTGKRLLWHQFNGCPDPRPPGRGSYASPQCAVDPLLCE